MTFLVRPHVSGGRGLSRTLWNAARLAEISMDPDAGFFFFDDFLDLPTGRYVDTTATNGTTALIDGDGGILQADSAGAAADQGENIQSAAEFVLPEADTEIWFEARIRFRDIGTSGANLQFFLGLAVESTTVFSAGVNNTDNHIGFEAIGTTDLDFVGEKATARDTVATVDTIIDYDVTETWHKLGFHVIGVDKAYAYIDGLQWTADNLATANIPATELALTLVAQTEAAADPIYEMDWWAVGKSFRIG